MSVNTQLPNLYLKYDYSDKSQPPRISVDWADGVSTACLVGSTLEPLELKAIFEYPVEISIEGYSHMYRSNIYHITRLDGFYPIAKLEHQIIKFWSFWRWWEVRIIETLAVWGIADIRPGEIPGWYCVNRK
jgi:hypothetical protein